MDRIFKVSRKKESDDIYQAWDLTACQNMIMEKQAIQSEDEWEHVKCEGKECEIRNWILTRGKRVGVVSFEVKTEEDGTAKFPPFNLQEPFSDDVKKFYIFTYDPYEDGTA